MPIPIDDKRTRTELYEALENAARLVGESHNEKRALRERIATLKADRNRIERDLSDEQRKATALCTERDEARDALVRVTLTLSATIRPAR